jgi:equilibrative nucleoside transporter 1/2/3
MRPGASWRQQPRCVPLPLPEASAWAAAPLAAAGRADSCGAPLLPLLLPQVWRPALSLFLLYVLTLSIFPGYLAEDVHSAELGDWYAIALITAFNAADLAGKNLPLAQAVRAHGTMLRLAAARFAFLPAFVAAALLRAPPAVMGLLTLLLGTSNGYLTAAAMTTAPAGLPAHCAEAVENIMVFCLVGGLTAGAFLGWLWLL